LQAEYILIIVKNQIPYFEVKIRLPIFKEKEEVRKWLNLLDTNPDDA